MQTQQQQHTTTNPIPTSNNIQNPFVVGTRVGVRKYGNAWHEDYVHAVYKSGNITLRSNPKQQYSVGKYPLHAEQHPFELLGYQWHASETGKSYGRRGHVRPWDACLEAEIAEQAAMQAHNVLCSHFADAFKYGEYLDQQFVAQLRDLFVQTALNQISAPKA